MTVDERLASIRIKIERAKKHIRDLEVEVRSFLDSQPYKVGAKRNPETRQLVYYLLSVQDAPPTIAAITGDVLQNLRSALDHLAYHLAVIGTGGKGPFRHIYFPISENAAKYKTERPGKVKGMRQDAIKAIDAIKPYGGGNDTLWHLHRLNNVDKHRLVITVGSAFHSVNVGAHGRHAMQKLVEQVWLEEDIVLPEIDVYVRPADRLFPLKAGDELLITDPDTEVNEKMQFVFEVAFGEPQIVEGEPLLKTLQQMIDLVDNIVLNFRTLLV